MDFEQQYLELVRDAIKGFKTFNSRTGKNTYVVLNRTLKYDANMPLLSTKKVNYKGAIAEIIGYLQGLDNASKFKELGTSTWLANAKNWNSDVKKDDTDMGYVYGKVAVQNPVFEIENSELVFKGKYRNTLEEIAEKIKKGEDDRGLILSFWNPSLLHLGCLRPCMYEHTFSLLGDKLYMTSTQRSADIALGLPYNMIQCWFLLHVMCQLTGKNFGGITHHIINCHIYEDQLEGLQEQLTREPYDNYLSVVWNKLFKSIEDINEVVDTSFINVLDYKHHPAIQFPFSV